MEELIKWIKANIKDGVDISQAETLAKGLNPLSGVDSIEKAAEFIKKTDVLQRAFDSLQSKAAAAHDEKFRAEKLPLLLKEHEEKIRKELNPEETEEQKMIREQQERIKALEAKDQRTALESQLREKAKEIGYIGSPERFAIYGEDAIKQLESEAARIKTAIDERVSSDIKKLYGDVKPPQTNQTDPSKTITRDAYDSMSPIEQANMPKDMIVVDE